MRGRGTFLGVERGNHRQRVTPGNPLHGSPTSEQEALTARQDQPPLSPSALSLIRRENARLDRLTVI
jgi:hypothetical protein